jgi:hypothetical protein
MPENNNGGAVIIDGTGTIPIANIALITSNELTITLHLKSLNNINIRFTNSDRLQYALEELIRAIHCGPICEI